MGAASASSMSARMPHIGISWRRAGALSGPCSTSFRAWDRAMSDERAVPSMRDLQGASWAALAAGPLAWFADQQVSYRVTIWVCNGGPSVVLYLVNLVALVVAASGIVIALRRW